MSLIQLNVYLPENVKGKYLFGCKTVKESNETSCTKSFINYFVIAADDAMNHGDLGCLGTCETLSTFNKTQSSVIKDSKDMEFNFITDDESNKVIKVTINRKEFPKYQDSTNIHHISLFYYEREKFQNTYSEVHQQSNVDSNFALYIAKALKDKHTKEVGETALECFSKKSHKTLVTFAAVSSKVLAPFSSIFDNTAIYRHCRNWRKCLNDDHSRNGFVVLDIMLGILFFLFMHHIQDSGRYFMDLTEIIVGKLRGLLEMLDGSPAGLKLNVQLNNFLLSCFMYHVDLWFNFIVIVEPAIHYLFLPITIFGFFGFTFQCALLCDIVTLITLHAHCFYIYAAMLYKLELSSIRSLLRIVLGRRLNVLKGKMS
jgi:N-acetylglucosaminyl transferase component (Gpi1)